MPDPRLVGLHELKSLIDRLNEANLRVSTAYAHLSDANVQDTEDLSYIKAMLEEDLLPRAIRLFKALQGDTLRN